MDGTSQQHSVEVVEVENADPRIPTGVHLRCSCGWTASAENPDRAIAVRDEHLRTGIAAPIPAAPSPD